MKKKSTALIVALVLALVCIAGGTLAWLTAKTDPVRNTFTTSDVDITLTETDAKNNQNTYQMVPGCTITKDPKVTVLKGSEKCYLFVKLEKSKSPEFDDYMTYEMADGWTALENVQDVYYREVEKPEEDQPFAVIKDDQVTVKEEVTKEMMNALNDSTSYPTLTVTAYASQYMKDNKEAFTPAEAWENVPK